MPNAKFVQDDLNEILNLALRVASDRMTYYFTVGDMDAAGYLFGLMEKAVAGRDALESFFNHEVLQVDHPVNLRSVPVRTMVVKPSIQE